MNPKLSDMIENEMLESLEITPCIDELQKHYEQEQEQIIKSKAPSVLCDAVLRAIQNDLPYIGLYKNGCHVYAQEFITEQQLKGENKINGKENTLSSHIVDCNLITSCIDYLYEQRDSFIKDEENCMSKLIANHFNRKIENFYVAYDKYLSTHNDMEI